MEEERRRVRAAHEALVRGGWLARVGGDDVEKAIWVDCGLATLVENRCFERIDPRTLLAAERERWRARMPRGELKERDPHADTWFRVCYWLLDEGERAGSVALAASPVGGGLLDVWTLYVFEERRRRGVAGRFLAAAREAVRREGLWGLKVGTEWTWPHVVGYYVRLGMWVRGWKRNIDFQWTDDPEYRVEFDGDAARFVVGSGSGESVLIDAVRRGERLEWREHPKPDGMDEYTSWLAPGTLAVVLALRGWPLIRSEEEWSRRFDCSDGGDPEGLARKIQIFEAVERGHGFEVRTPRIPGLTYPPLDDID